MGLIERGIEEYVESLPDSVSDDEAVNRLVERNVDSQVGRLIDSEDVPDGVDVVGGVYDFQDIYSEERGRFHVINVNGENDVGRLREENPEIEDSIDRLTSP